DSYCLGNQCGTGMGWAFVGVESKENLYETGCLGCISSEADKRLVAFNPVEVQLGYYWYQPNVPVSHCTRAFFQVLMPCDSVYRFLAVPSNSSVYPNDYLVRPVTGVGYLMQDFVYNLDGSINTGNVQLIANYVTSFISSLRSNYDSVSGNPDYPGWFDSRDRLFYIVLVMYNYYNTYLGYRTEVYIYPAVRLGAFSYTKKVDVGGLGSRQQGQGGNSQGRLSHGRGLGGYEVQN
ncbi:MAG: hypothetical protein U0937_02150, partial [Thermodesulfovibrionia bacterium]|nr:hypothetical protein [Thermodesulfovibrionia bacterium]